MLRKRRNNQRFEVHGIVERFAGASLGGQDVAIVGNPKNNFRLFFCALKFISIFGGYF